MSKIVTDTAEILLAVFAGQTVTHDEVLTAITQQYELARKRSGMTSYFKVTNLLESKGATYRYTGPNYTGECLYTFPAINVDETAA